MALWGGRFEAGVAEVTQEFGASLPVDKHLYKQDIAGSKAHAKMLAAQGIISAEDEQAIAEGLTESNRISMPATSPSISTTRTFICPSRAS